MEVRRLVLTMVMVSIMVCMTAVAAKPCTVPRGPCRIETMMETIDGNNMTSLNISCYCKYSTEEASHSLRQLTNARCSWIPWQPDEKVNISSIHLTGCNFANDVFPEPLLKLARRTDHLEIVVNKVPKLSLSKLTQAQHVSSINATFSRSNLTGLPEGWLSGADWIKMTMEDCGLPIIQDHAFSEYPPTAHVQLTFVNTDIYTVKPVAFELPPGGTFTMIGGRVLAWEISGFSGGSQVLLEGVVLGRVLEGALNLHGVDSFTMTDCTVAELYAEAIQTNSRGRRSDDQYTRMESATVIGNNLLNASGSAFVHLCSFSTLSWSNNTFVNLVDPPLLLQTPACKTKRDWSQVVDSNGLNCNTCDSFVNPNEQNCAVYKSGYCTTCDGKLFDCNVSILPYLVTLKCLTSHPELTEELQNTCNYSPSSTAEASSRSLDGGSGNDRPSSEVFLLLLMVVCVMLNGKVQQ